MLLPPVSPTPGVSSAGEAVPTASTAGGSGAAEALTGSGGEAQPGTGHLWKYGTGARAGSRQPQRITVCVSSKSSFTDFMVLFWFFFFGLTV